MVQSGQSEMFPSPPAAEGLVVINQRCQFRTQEGHRVVMASGLILAQYAVGDRMSEAYAMVSLVEQGLAEQEAVAVAFGYTARTVRRYQAPGASFRGRTGRTRPAERLSQGAAAPVLLAPAVGEPTEGRREPEYHDRTASGRERDGRAQASAAGGLAGHR